MSRVRAPLWPDITEIITQNKAIDGDSPSSYAKLAPGEARTPDLRISSSILTYKYDALTDCATGAQTFAPLHYFYINYTVHLAFLHENTE